MQRYCQRLALALSASTHQDGTNSLKIKVFKACFSWHIRQPHVGISTLGCPDQSFMQGALVRCFRHGMAGCPGIRRTLLQDNFGLIFRSLPETQQENPPELVQFHCSARKPHDHYHQVFSLHTYKHFGRNILCNMSGSTTQKHSGRISVCNLCWPGNSQA